MSWPTPQDYNEAIQSPSLSFTDRELQSGHPELTALGLPRPIAGGFANVYKILSGGRQWAARCFLTDVPDQQQRYEAISKHLAAAHLAYTVPFTYLSPGIRVLGKPYPLIKMEWVQGESLSSFVGRTLSYPSTLLSVAKVWSKMVSEVRAANISHGDLQHGNVLVVGDELRLIDYDGMFVPALAGKRSNECGHRNYQHPARTEFDYGPELDNFSAWVVYFSLIALSVHPELWTKHRGGDECLLLRKEDFAQPGTSIILRNLGNSSNVQVRSLTQLFIGLLSFSPQNIPSLDGNLPKETFTGAPGGAPSTATNWWGDHVEAASPQDKVSVEQQASSDSNASLPDLTWIIDSLDAPTTEKHLQFTGSMLEPRIVLVGSVILLFGFGLFAEVSISTFSLSTLSVAGFNLLLCYFRYRSDPNFSEYNKFKRESEALSQQIRSQQSMADSFNSERVRVQEKLSMAESSLLRKKAQLSADLQASTNEKQMRLTSALRDVDTRRRDAVKTEATELQKVQRNIGDQIAELDRKLSGTRRIMDDEKDKALKVLQDEHIRTYLSGFSIAQAKVHGIGPSLTSGLRQAGIVTAVDVDKWRILKVPGFGHFRAEALVEWRDDLQSNAKKSLPTRLPRSQITAVENRFQTSSQQFESDKQLLQKQIDVQITSVRQKSAAAQQSLTAEEQRLKNQSYQELAALRQSNEAHIQDLEVKLRASKSQSTLAIAPLNEKLLAAQRKMFGLHWQVARQEKEKERFRSMRFQDYLKFLIRP